MSDVIATTADIDARARRIARVLRREFGDELDFADIAAHIEIGVRGAKLMGMPLDALLHRIVDVYANAHGPQAYAGVYVDTTGEEGSS